jgi:hypothetical protein
MSPLSQKMAQTISLLQRHVLMFRYSAAENEPEAVPLYMERRTLLVGHIRTSTILHRHYHKNAELALELRT